MLNSGLETLLWPLLLGGSPWRWQNTQPDHATMAPASAITQSDYAECACAFLRAALSAACSRQSVVQPFECMSAKVVSLRTSQCKSTAKHELVSL